MAPSKNLYVKYSRCPINFFFLIMPSIPFFKPTITKKDILEVLNYMASDLESQNEFKNRFEKKITTYLKTSKAILLSHISAALYLIAKQLEFNSEDEVIVSGLGERFIVSVLKLFGVKVVMVDNEPEHLSMSIADIRKKITHRTKSIILTHQLGYYAPTAELMPYIQKIKREQGQKIWLIEDLSQSFGTNVDGTPIGRHGDFGICSFSQNRIISLGEGGLIFGRQTDDFRSFDSLRQRSFIAEDNEIHGGQLDFSATEIQAAMGIAEINLIDKFIKKRREIARYYDQCLSASDHFPIFPIPQTDISDAQNPSLSPQNGKKQHDQSIDIPSSSISPHKAEPQKPQLQMNHYAYPVHFNIDLGLVRDTFKKYGVHLRELSYGSNLQNRDVSDLNAATYFPNIHKQMEHILCVPIYPTMLKTEIEMVGKLLKNVR